MSAVKVLASTIVVFFIVAVFDFC